MKKFFAIPFVFFLAISMISLVGCNGLWDFDDDDDAVAAPLSVEGTVETPAGSVANLRAAVASGDLRAKLIKLDGTDAGSAASLTAGDTANTFKYKCQFSSVTTTDFYFVKIFAENTNFEMRTALGKLTKTSGTLDNKKVDSTTTAKSVLIVKEVAANGADSVSDLTAFEAKIATVISDFTKVVENNIGKTVDLFNASTDITTLKDADDKPASIPATGVSIANGTTANIEKKGTLNLTANLTPAYTTDSAGSVVWAIVSGNDPELIQLNTTTGAVTAVAVGGPVKVSATINGLSATIDITVTKLLPTSIAIDKASLTLETGDTSQLTVTEVLPADADDKSYTWSSSNAAVAAVDPTTGLVTAAGAGTANIIVTTVNGKTAQCTVKVESAINEVATVHFDNKVSGVIDADIRIQITGFPTTFTTTSAKVTNTAGAELEFKVAPSLSDATTMQLFLAYNPVDPKTIADFQELTFTPAIPRGATVKIVTGSGTLTTVATSDNIPAAK